MGQGKEVERIVRETGGAREDTGAGRTATREEHDNWVLGSIAIHRKRSFGVYTNSVRIGLRPILTAHQVVHARTLVGQGESPRDVAKLLGVSRRTVYRA